LGCPKEVLKDVQDHVFWLVRRLGAAGELLFVLAGIAGVTHADKLGGAAAVNPDAFSSLNGAPKSQLN
jgi:hypothetical protein